MFLIFKKREACNYYKPFYYNLIFKHLHYGNPESSMPKQKNCLIYILLYTPVNKRVSSAVNQMAELHTPLRYSQGYAHVLPVHVDLTSLMLNQAVDV